MSLHLIQQVLITAGLVMVAIILHELAHGYAAWAMGDITAKRGGRLSLNPLVHVDRVGTILLPGFLLISQLVTVGHVLFMFGWAKPVPVDASRFRYPRQQMAVVALAGPVMNFSLALLAAFTLRTPGLSAAWLQAIGTFIVLNLVLGLFNLVPIPPLDGGRIAVGLLPLPLARQWAKMERLGIVLVLVFLTAGPALLRANGIAFNPLGDTLVPAVTWVYEHLLILAHVPPSPDTDV